MKVTPLILTLSLILLILPGTAHSEVSPEEEFFSVKGTVTAVDGGAETLLVKIEEGLELTFYINKATQITQGGVLTSFSSLTPGNEVEIQYLYNRDYQKIAQTVKKRL